MVYYDINQKVLRMVNHIIICPRFWCIKDPKKIGGKDMSNKPLSKQVDEGKCGG